MEKPAASEQAAATAPAEEAEPVDTYQYQYPPIELFEKSKEESDPNAEDELKANAQKLVDTLESFGVRTRVLDISRGPSVTRYEAVSYTHLDVYKRQDKGQVHEKTS